jgi:hypothetical protein
VLASGHTQVSNKNSGSFDLEVNGVTQRYTWHHHEDGKTLMPVVEKFHKAATHSGGTSIINNSIENLFSPPF